MGVGLAGYRDRKQDNRFQTDPEKKEQGDVDPKKRHRSQKADGAVVMIEIPMLMPYRSQQCSQNQKQDDPQEGGPEIHNDLLSVRLSLHLGT
jgi:hypothetical protein